MPKDGSDDAEIAAQCDNPLLKTRAIDLRRQGMKVQEIADKIGVHRVTVSRWLNSRDVKEIIDEAKARLKALIEPAVEVYAMSLKNAPQDMTNGQRAARDILKNFGLIKDQVDLNHTFPKPTVIKRMDGTEVILGVEGEHAAERTDPGQLSEGNPSTEESE